MRPTSSDKCQITEFDSRLLRLNKADGINQVMTGKKALMKWRESATNSSWLTVQAGKTVVTKYKRGIRREDSVVHCLVQQQ